MSKGTVRVILDLHFDGDYYEESERASMAESWINRGLDDRSDLLGWTYVETNHRAGNGSTEEATS